MLWRRLSYLHLRIRRRGPSWLALVGQLVAVIGLPLPAASAKDISKPFPCQGRACGCMSAGDCWKNCCCFTAGQRVAWADEHDVEAPPELVEEASQEHPCCSEEEEKPCCVDKKHAKKAGASAASAAWVLVIQARRCHGGSAGESDAVPSCPPGLPVDWRFDWTLIASIPSSAMIPLGLAHLPEAPPPRIA
jgi:hypothetical protein